MTDSLITPEELTYYTNSKVIKTKRLYHLALSSQYSGDPLVIMAQMYQVKVICHLLQCHNFGINYYMHKLRGNGLSSWS